MNRLDWLNSFADRFLERLRKDYVRRCWLWTAGLNNCGYGSVWNGHIVMLAHRVSYEMFCGPIPDEFCVLHQCDVRTCCNPTHLFLGTRADNNADKMAKGRHIAATGERNGQSKLVSSQIPEIIKLVKVDGLSRCEVARRFGVSNQLVSRIVAGDGWAHARAKK